MAVETRCSDCRDRARAAVADGEWLIDAGVPRGSPALIEDVFLAILWHVVGEAHDEGARR